MFRFAVDTMRLPSKNSSDGEIDDPVAPFRLSVRLEASRRILRKEWWKQLVVWVMSFTEVSTTAVIPGLHLVTSPHVTAAVMLLTLLFSCLRAGSFLDPFLNPAHVLRPKHHSRFGLGVHQRGSTKFSMASLVVRVACSVAFTLIFLLFLIYRVEPIMCSERFVEGFPWAYYDSSEIDSDLKVCAENPDVNRTLCGILGDFKRRCHDPVRLSEHLRKDALDVGVTCNQSALPASFLEIEYVRTEYCIAPDGTQLNCSLDEFLPLDLWIWTSGKIQLNQACGSWPPTVLEYHCNILFDGLDSLNNCSTAPEVLIWDSIVSRRCELRECTERLPDWMHNLLDKWEKLNLCDCRSCKHWSRSTICTLEEVDLANRRHAGLELQELSDIIRLSEDPRYFAQIFSSAVLVIWPWVWCLTLALFCCCRGNPFAVPLNVELQERILAEEMALQDELRSNGYIAKSPALSRSWMIMELGFYAADVILDCQMFWLYQDKQHYWFAAVQGFIIIRTIADLALRQCICSRALLYDIWHSLKTNLRTDTVLSILQGEKTGEAVLSMFLQVYSLFYMGTDTRSYFSAISSLMVSGCGIAYGCYIHFDLAVVFGEVTADIVPTEEKSNDTVHAPAHEPPMLEVEAAAKIATSNFSPDSNSLGENLKAAETNNSKADGAPTLIGASSTFSVVIPGASSSFIRRRSFS